MWPKNLTLYRFSREFNVEADKLETCLSEYAFKPCGETDMCRMGWVSPLLGRGQMHSHVVGSNVVLRACIQKRKVPASVLKDELAKRINEVERTRGEPVKAKERRDIKDALLMELLPRVFPTTKYVNVYILWDLKMLAVDESSWKSAEDVLSMLRKSIGSLPCTPVIPEVPIETTLTKWVLGSSAPEGFEMLGEIELTNVTDGQSVLRGINQDITDEKLISHLESARVTKLGLDWQGRLSFVLKDCGLMTKVKWSEDTKDANDDIPKEDVAARMDSDFALLSGELSAFIPILYEALGGLPQPELG